MGASGEGAVMQTFFAPPVNHQILRFGKTFQVSFTLGDVKENTSAFHNNVGAIGSPWDFGRILSNKGVNMDKIERTQQRLG